MRQAEPEPPLGGDGEAVGALVRYDPNICSKKELWQSGEALSEPLVQLLL